MDHSAKWKQDIWDEISFGLESNNHSTGQSPLYKPYQIMVLIIMLG